jgi:hypothetical protein
MKYGCRNKIFGDKGQDDEEMSVEISGFVRERCRCLKLSCEFNKHALLCSGTSTKTILYGPAVVSLLKTHKMTL